MKYIKESLNDFNNKIERALAGFIYNKNNNKLKDNEIKTAKDMLNDVLEMGDYMEVVNILDDWSPGNDEKILKNLEDIFSQYNIDIRNYIRRDISKFNYKFEKYNNTKRNHKLKNIFEKLNINYKETPKHFYLMLNETKKQKLNEKLSNFNKNKKLDEKVLGISSTADITRISELAGMHQDELLANSGIQKQNNYDNSSETEHSTINTNLSKSKKDNSNDISEAGSEIYYHADEIMKKLYNLKINEVDNVKDKLNELKSHIDYFQDKY